MKPAVFLDRDGVLIENRPDYVRVWDDVMIYPQALASLAEISHLPFLIVVVTNQSAVGRGLISLDDAQEINSRLVNRIEQAGGRIDAVYMCPHAPWEACECRKPQPGLFFQAANELEIDLSQSLMIGDALTDLEAALAAGVPRVALVRTGRGELQQHLPNAKDLHPMSVYPELKSALNDRLLAHPQSGTVSQTT